jgi:hypothetical protein
MRANDPDKILAKALASVYRLILSWPDPLQSKEEVIDRESITDSNQQPSGLDGLQKSTDSWDLEA